MGSEVLKFTYLRDSYCEDRAQLLDVLYYFIVPNPQSSQLRSTTVRRPGIEPGTGRSLGFRPAERRMAAADSTSLCELVLVLTSKSVSCPAHRLPDRANASPSKLLDPVYDTMAATTPGAIVTCARIRVFPPCR